MRKKIIFRLSKEALLPGVLFALLVRWCVAAYPYSGYRKPPMYGDYEAQRHWQEITLQTPLAKWYHNTSQNDLQYWGLDYPPLSAYHSLLMGLVADWIDPESVRLFASRGYENETHKMFMRWTVFLCDVYFYVTAAFILCVDSERIKCKEDKNVFKRTDVATILFLLYPGTILIDHGHFQYNCVSLGLFLWATFFIVALECDTLGTISFVLALNYKQMELYHSLPFFVYLLRKCMINLPIRHRLQHLIHRINKLIIAVVSCFIIIWYPFMHNSWRDVLQVVHRVFPLKRGVFEDKVSNVWCVANVFVKLKYLFTNEEMAQICFAMTVLAVLPSCIDLFIKINKDKVVLSLINVSLAFFLFSFQVHEKTILLVAVPVAVFLPKDPFISFWFLLVSNFSMLPLLVRDGLILPYLVTTMIYMFSYNLALKIYDNKMGLFAMFNASRVYRVFKPHMKNKHVLHFLSVSFSLSVLGMFLLTAALVFLKPPVQYPDLFPLLISAYSCCHFLLFCVYFNYKQMCLPTVFPDYELKVKSFYK